MRRTYFLLALLLVSLASGAQSFTIGQFNVRYDNVRDQQAGNGWNTRVKKIGTMIRYEDWDIFGAQEVLHDQLNDLLNTLNGYDYIGVGRNDGETKGEYAPIFYKKSRFQCLKNGQFWISETPDIAGSKGWDADQTRICTWGLFEDKSSKWRFWAFNLHMDHKGVKARHEGAKLVLAKIRELCGDQPYILTGDFNVDQNNEIYELLTSSGALIDTYAAAGRRMAETGTTNSFKSDYHTDSRIDHIFVSPRFRTHAYGILTYAYWKPIEKTNKRSDTPDRGADEMVQHDARMLSDHYPVVARVELPRLRTPQDWASYKDFEAANLQEKNAKVVFMGNSITWNWKRKHPDFFTEGYVCRGISGQVTAQMLARFRSDVINLQPETVVILAGTNDIAMNQGYVSIEHIYENIISMAELARFNGINVVLCSVLPADSYSWSWEISRERAINSIRELNDKLYAYAMMKGLQYADYYSVMIDESFAMKKEYQDDSVHPNSQGYIVMEEVIQKILYQ